MTSNWEYTETDHFNDLLKAQRNLAEVNDEILRAAKALLTPNYLEKLTPNEKTTFYKFLEIEDSLECLILHEKKFLQTCEKEIKRNKKLVARTQNQKVTA